MFYVPVVLNFFLVRIPSSEISPHLVRFEVFTTVTMKNGVLWDVTPCGSCKNRRFGGTYRLLHQDDKIGELGTTLAATSNRRTLRRKYGISSQRASVASCS
jgi:hypothetical protein